MRWNERHGGDVRERCCTLTGRESRFSELSTVNTTMRTSGSKRSLYHLRCFPAGRSIHRHRHNSWNSTRGFVTRDDQFGKNNTKSVLEGGRGNSQSVKLEEITIVEAVSEETASTEGVQVERQSAEGGWELRRLAGLGGDLCNGNGLGNGATMT